MANGWIFAINNYPGDKLGMSEILVLGSQSEEAAREEAIQILGAVGCRDHTENCRHHELELVDGPGVRFSSSYYLNEGSNY